MLRTNLTAEAIDEVLAGTFPASDAPAWTPGVARPAPGIHSRAAEHAATEPRAGVIDVSRPAIPRTLGQALTSQIAVAGLALMVPLVILAVGVPVALGVGSALVFAEWLMSLMA